MGAPYQPHRSFACLRCPPYCLHCREMVHVGSETQSEVPLDRTCIHGRRAAFDRLLIRIYGPLIRPDPTARAFASPTVDALSRRSRTRKKRSTFRFSSSLALFPLRDNIRHDCERRRRVRRNNNVANADNRCDVCAWIGQETATRVPSVVVFRNAANL